MSSYLYKKQKKRFFLYTAAVVMATGLEIALAYVMSICVELAINRELSQFARYGVIFLGYVGLVSLSDYLVKYLRARVLENAQIELRNDSTRRLLAMDFVSFHRRNTGDWVSLLTNDVELVGQSYFTTILLMVPDVLSFLVSLVCVFWFSWPMALFVLALTAGQMLIPKLLSPAISQAKDSQSQRAADYTITATEHLQGFDLLQSFHLTAQSFISLSRSSAKWEEAKFRVKYLNALEKAGFAPVLDRFAGGLEERIGQSGQNLSGGEKQRIALARMFLFHTPFLILDESFANLDRESMTELLRRITLDQEGTVLYIGHNIPADIVEMFDTVLELQSGRMQEV